MNIFEKHMADKSYDDYILRRNASLCVNATITGEESEDVLEALSAVLVEIHRAPAADVVPVVRCSECMHFLSFGNGYGECRRTRRMLANIMKPTDFCSYAEKLPLPEYDDHTVSGLLDD